MKKILYSMLAALVLLSAGACGDDEYTDSRITNYVTINLKGGSVYTVSVGSSYTDPGFTALEGTTDVTDKVKVEGEVDATKVGVYPVTYSAANTDGFSKSVTRTVIVYNSTITTDLSGTYVLQEGSYRLRRGTQTPYSGYKIEISKAADGVFHISDFLGGYYDQRSGYGAAYALTGYFSLNADNSLTALSSFLSGWGDSLDDGFSGTYTPQTGVISYMTPYAGMEFHVILKK